MNSSTQDVVKHFTEREQRWSKDALFQLNEMLEMIDRQSFKQVPDECVKHISNMWGLAHSYGDQAKKAKHALLKALENDHIR